MNPWWDVYVPLPVLLAAVATLGYMVGRWRRSGELCPRCQQEVTHPVASAATPAPEAVPKA